MNRGSLAVVALLLAGCSSQSAPAGEETYRLTTFECHSCDPRRGFEADSGAVDCGEWNGFAPDAGGSFSQCVSGAIDAGQTWKLIRVDYLFETEYVTVFAQDQSGTRILSYENWGSYRPRCQERLSGYRCDSFDAGSLQCLSRGELFVVCDETANRDVVELGRRPISELDCSDAGVCRRVSPGTSSTPPAFRPVTCVEFDGRITCHQE